MQTPPVIPFKHILLYVWLVGFKPALTVITCFALGVGLYFLLNTGIVILVAVILSLPLSVASALKGAESFAKRFPQYMVKTR